MPLTSNDAKDIWALCELAAGNPAAHFVLCRADNKAPTRPWLDYLPTPADMWLHQRAGGVIGLVPFTLGYTVVDVDTGPPHALADVAAPAVIAPTKSRGHGHLYYPDGVARGNAKWKWSGMIGPRKVECAGEIRGGSGYVVLWPGTAEALLCGVADDAAPFSAVMTEIMGAGSAGPPVAQPRLASPAPATDAETGLTFVPEQPSDDARKRHLAKLVEAGYDADDRETWIMIGIALYHGVEAADLANADAFWVWCQWAAQSSKFNYVEHQTKWRKDFPHRAPQSTGTGRRVTPGKYMGGKRWS